MAVLTKKKNSKQNPYLEPVTNEPYLTSRQNRYDRHLMILMAGRFWRRTASLALLLNMVLVVGIVFVAKQRKEIPYVVSVDRSGWAIPVGRALETPLDKIIQFHLRDFIRAARSISFDTYAMERNFKHAYHYVQPGSNAWTYLNDFYIQEQKPFERAKNEAVYLDRISMIHLSKRTWKLRWSEVSRSMDGHEIAREAYWGEITIDLFPVTTNEQRAVNPMGIQISNITWAKE